MLRDSACPPAPRGKRNSLLLRCGRGRGRLRAETVDGRAGHGSTVHENRAEGERWDRRRRRARWPGVGPVTSRALVVADRTSIKGKSSLQFQQSFSGEHHHDERLVTARPGVDLGGRSAELELMDSLFVTPDRSGPGLLLRGAPGVGKTALLDTAAVRAADVGMRVLRASAVEFEAEMSFSALHQMLYPLRHHADRLAVHHRDVLDRIFGLAWGPSLDPLAASAAVLALLGEVCVERPLLLIADDVPWIDCASATVLGFVVRRISDDPIVFLAAMRTGASGFWDQLQLPVREIGPLAAQAAAELLDARWPGLGPSVRRRVLAEAAGNPLALRELPAALTSRQRSGRDPLPALLPLPERLQAAFAPAIERLPAPTRKVLLLAALDADASLTTIRKAAPDSPAVDNLTPAQEADLVHVDAADGGVSFRHPLIRAAIVHLTPPGERRAAHQALAAALTGEPYRRALHLAEAATGPDEAVARTLDEAALSTWRRGDPSSAAARASDEAAVSDRRRVGASAAVTTLIRAGELSPHPGDRSRRLVEAAYLANITGQLDQVQRLLADAGQAPDTPTGLVFAATAHFLTNNEGDVDAAHRLLARALDDVADTSKPTDNWDSYGILYALLHVGFYVARPQPWELLNTAMARFESEAVTPFRLCYDAFVDGVRTAATVREGLDDAFAALPADAAPWQLTPLVAAACATDVLSDYRHLVRSMIERERDRGAIALIIHGLLSLSSDSWARGRWDEAESLAREGLDLATVYGYHLFEGTLRAHLALIAAARGNADLARSLADELTAWAVPSSIGVTQVYAPWARTLAALSQGDYEEAYVQASRVNPPSTPSPGIPGRWMVMDLVEAAVRTGRIDQARAHVAAVQQAGIHRISPRTALMTAGAAALAADDDEAGALFEAALSLPEAAKWPWEHARIQLAYGQWLRRTRAPRARLHLSAALETFDRLGATTMAQRARNELRATGVVTATGPDAPTAALTVQERQIAELAAMGLTNKQIGERLFLSHRTVGSHLHRLYPKLGITSRAALRAALETMAPGDDDQDGGESRSPSHD
ncbi:LuxR C-terminal-related transcriptional regulator [Streptomyces sp. NPDC002619]|uniref:LuxR C-terminal-related transcriptional regulator n=1 Tax=Streptomyces sp. NPDC002619 TaxID=3364655 RepID=UPI00369EB27E